MFLFRPHETKQMLQLFLLSQLFHSFEVWGDPVLSRHHNYLNLKFDDELVFDVFETIWKRFLTPNIYFCS